MKRFRMTSDEYGYWEGPEEHDLGEWVRFTDAEAAIKAAVEAEREWILNYLAECGYEISLKNAEAIRARGEEPEQ